MAQDCIKVWDSDKNILSVNSDGSLVNGPSAVSTSGWIARNNGINFEDQQVMDFPPSGEHYNVGFVMVSASGACYVDIDDNDGNTIIPRVYLAAQGGAVIPIPPKYEIPVTTDKQISIKVVPSGTYVSYMVAGVYV